MKPLAKRIIMRSLFFLIIGSAGLVIIDQFTSWSTTEKLIWPIIWIAAAILNLFGTISPKNNNAVKEKPHGHTGSLSTASDKQTPQASSPAITFIFELIVWGGILFLCYAGFSMLYEFFANNTREAIKNDRRVVVSTPFGGSRDIQTKDRSKIIWINPGTTYDLFELKSGQKWKWYFDRDIEFRIKATGEESFIPLTRHPYSGQEPLADHAGMLQVRTKAKNNRVEAYRFVPYIPK